MILGEECNVGVDDITCLDRGAELPDRPGMAGIEGLFAGAGQESGEERLAFTVPPSLGDTPRRGDDLVFAAPGGFDESCDLPVATFKGDQGAGVENESHSGGTPAPASCLLDGALLADSGSAEKPVGLGNFVIGEIAVLFFPVPHRVAEGLEAEPVTSRFRQPGGHALVAIRR
jgi:hypothetical protein